jgi:hypothetical protein
MLRGKSVPPSNLVRSSVASEEEVVNNKEGAEEAELETLVESPLFQEVVSSDSLLLQRQMRSLCLWQLPLTGGGPPFAWQAHCEFMMISETKYPT